VAHPRVEVSNLSCFSILVGDLDMLVGARVNHHIPGVPIQAIIARGQKAIYIYTFVHIILEK
jgi:hypothetical protein